MTNTETELETQKAPAPSTEAEVLDTRSPDEIEAEFLKQAEDDAIKFAENRDPAEIAAMMFHMFYPQFKGLVIGLSNKELRRLVTALVGKGHQSEPEVPKFNEKRTGQAYKMGLEILQAKFMMITKLEMDMIEKAENEKAARLLENVVVTEERGEAALKE